MPACLVVQVKDGRITRLEEYLDSAHAARLSELARGNSPQRAGEKQGLETGVRPSM